MGEKIYCVDLSGEITPIMVRDAIIKCFTMAHSEILDMMKEFHEFKSNEDFEEMERIDISFLVKLKFRELDLDFDNPTKKDLIAVIDKLAEYASSFRKPDIIKKHYTEIMKLIDKLP
jgi:hypothetical protein